jgi:hypothetical protein
VLCHEVTQCKKVNILKIHAASCLSAHRNHCLFPVTPYLSSHRSLHHTDAPLIIYDTVSSMSYLWVPVCNSLSTTPWRCVGSEGVAPRFLISALDGGEWSAAYPSHPRERAYSTHCIGGWVIPRAGSGCYGEEEGISPPSRM